MTSYIRSSSTHTWYLYFPQGYSEPKEEGNIWQTLLHRITTARRVTGGLLVSYANRFSSGSCVVAQATSITYQ
jgi:hypothetical protein